MTKPELPTPEELQRRCAALLADWQVRDREVEVVWNGRLSTTAGRAFVRRGRIELNPRLLARVPEEVEGVLIHEAAHVAAFRLFGPNIPAHGRHWRSLMRHAGQEPRVTHKLPVDGLRRQVKARSRSRYLYLRLCEACGDREVLERVSYGRCRTCQRRDNYLVVKAPASAAGRRALSKMTVTDVRARFA